MCCCCCCCVASVMSDSVRPHWRKPTRFPRPWDSPGKNTGVGCHFLLQCVKVKSEREVAQSCPTLCDPMDYSLPGSSIHGIFQARVLEWVPWEIQLIFLCETWQSHWILWKALLCTRVQSCSSLCNPVDCSPSASSVHFMLMDFLCKRLYHLEIMMVSFLLFHFLPSSCFLS